MTAAMSQTTRASQELILMTDDSSDSEDYKPSTQEIITAQTQEATNASDFFDQIRASQISINSGTSPTNSQTLSPANSQSNDSRIHSLDIKNAIYNAVVLDFGNGQQMVEKKKRGRKRKIRTAEELVDHLREKKEKNRLAAQRLRKKKGQEVAKYDEELTVLEANVKEKKRFAELIQTKVDKLRTKIEAMASEKRKELEEANRSQIIVKSEHNQSRGKRLERLSNRSQTSIVGR